MEQHPIPQQISSYQFKLVGDMTLKQFFQVAGGALVGLLFYSTPLHPLIKWPIILIAASLGAAMAFLPFQERPLEKWILSFFRSIYSPTWFVWKKGDNNPENFFTEAPAPAINTGNIDLASTPQASVEEHKKLESAEQSFLSKITTMTSVANQPITPVAAADGVTPPSVSISAAPIAPVQPASSIPPISTVQAPLAPITVPQQMPTLITKSVPKLIVEEKPAAPIMGTDIKQQDLTSNIVSSKTLTSKEAEFSVDAAPPNPPTIPNTVVGQVIDQDRKIISGAILEIRDSAGRPVRALKSNLVGHFIIVTPLLNGKYEINTEKEGYNFEPVSFTTDGSIIPPIAIRGSVVATA